MMARDLFSCGLDVVALEQGQGLCSALRCAGPSKIETAAVASEAGISEQMVANLGSNRI